MRSLPTRERGLKWAVRCMLCMITMSLPTRERGLKFLYLRVLYLRVRSLPTRERGLKYPASLALSGRGMVAPYAGAWIEILLTLRSCPLQGSLPTRERGLK